MHPHLVPDLEHAQLGCIVMECLQPELHRVSIMYAALHAGRSYTRCSCVRPGSVRNFMQECLPTPRGCVQILETQLANPPNQNG